MLFVTYCNLAVLRDCLAEYTVHRLSTCYLLLTAFVLLNSVARWCNATQFFTKMVSFYMLACMCVGRNFSRGGGIVDFYNRFSKVGQKWCIRKMKDLTYQFQLCFLY